MFNAATASLSASLDSIVDEEDFRTPEEKKFDRDLKKAMKKKPLK